MRKIHKITNIALIFMLIGVVLCSSVYPACLRPAMQSNQLQKKTTIKLRENDKARRLANDLLEKAKGPEWIRAYEAYLALAKEYPEVISNEWVDLIVFYWPVSSYPISFEIFTELARLKPDVVITEDRIKQLVDVFTRPRPLTPEIIQKAAVTGEKRFIPSDFYSVTGFDYAVKQFGELVKVAPGILTPDRVIDMIASFYRLNLNPTPELVISIFEGWLDNEKVMEEADPEALKIAREYLDFPERYDPFSTEFIHYIRQPLFLPAPDVEVLLPVPKAESQALVPVLPTQGMALAPTESTSDFIPPDIESALQESLENYPLHRAQIFEVLEVAANCDRQVLNAVMYRIMEYLANLGPSGKEYLEYFPNEIDAAFGGNWIMHTRVVSALQRISLFRRDLRGLRALISAKTNPNELAEEEIDAIDPANFYRDCPEYFSMLFMLGYRFDSKDRKWKRPGVGVRGKFFEEPRKSLAGSTEDPEAKVDRIGEIQKLDDKKELMRILADSRDSFFNRFAAARRMAELKTVELKDFRHVLEYYPYRYDIVSKALTFFALGQKGRYEPALRDDIINLVNSLSKRREGPLFTMAAQNVLRVLGEIDAVDFQPIRFGTAVRLFEQIPAINTVIFEDLFGREYFLLCEPPAASQLRSLPDLEFEVPVFCDHEDKWFITRGTEYNAVTSSVLVELIEGGRLKVFIHSHLKGEAEPTDKDFEHLHSLYAFIVSSPGIARYFIDKGGAPVSQFIPWGDVPEDFLRPANIAVEIFTDLSGKCTPSARKGYMAIDAGL